MNRTHFKTGILLLVAVFVAQAGFSKIIRVNNRPGVADGTMVYATLSAGYAQAARGDTIHIEGSPTGYGNLTLTKEKIIIIGPGYFLTANDSTEAYKQPANLMTLEFASGCDSTVVYGLDLNSVVINANNVRLARCRITCPNNVAAVNLATAALHDVFIERNYIHQSNGNGDAQACIYVAANCDDLVIRNNIIRKHNNTTDAPAVHFVGGGDVIFKNNVVFGRLNLFANATVLNNVLGYGSYAYGAYLNLFYNNIGNGTQFGNNDGNQENVNMNTVLSLTSATLANGSNATMNDDAYYDLCSGSVAIGTGLHGENCGAYRKWYPTAESYIKSGMAPVPAIFDADVANYGNGATGLDVTIHAMSHH